MAKYYFPVILHKECDGGYSVFMPDLEGCNTQGDTLEEAYEMASDAIGLYLDDIKVEDYPKISSPDEIALDKNELLGMVCFDKMEYDKKNNTRPVKKTLTIPAWLDEVAKKERVNFSGVLQDALKEKLKIG